MKLLKAAAAMAVALAVMAPGSAFGAHRKTIVPPPQSKSFGVSISGLPTSLRQLQSFESTVGRQVGIADYYDDFASPNFNAAAATAIANQGMTPMLAWEAMDGTLADPVNQQAYTLASIIDGSHDPLLTTWAREIKAWGRPFMLRFAPEMNGNWNPWSEGVNGNTSGQYVQAWRHAHDLFVAAGATNVQWIWNENVDYDGSTPLLGLYPGDAYVDMVGIDGYNWGTSQSWSSWQTPQQVFDPTINDIRTFTAKPIIICEVASSELGGSKAQWVTQFFAWLKASDNVTGFVWFEFNKETNWLVESSASSKAAFIAGLGTL
jgi:beta-mannanase